MADRLATDPWAIRARAEQARMRAEEAARIPVRSPAIAKAVAAMEAHAERWVEARTAAAFPHRPVRDLRLDLVINPDARRSPLRSAA